jgi:hypothetical protein
MEIGIQGQPSTPDIGNALDHIVEVISGKMTEGISAYGLTENLHRRQFVQM